jgi:hypothetical protein
MVKTRTFYTAQLAIGPWLTKNSFNADFQLFIESSGKQVILFPTYLVSEALSGI